MLTLSRRKEETVVLTIGDIRVTVQVVVIRGKQVKIGFTAPQEVVIHRGEIQKLIDSQREEKSA